MLRRLGRVSVLLFGLASGRLVGLIVDTDPGSYNFAAFGFEVLSASAAFALLSKESAVVLPALVLAFVAGDVLAARSSRVRAGADATSGRTIRLLGFDFPISGQNTESARLINEAGLLVAFMLDGKCAPVIEAHQRFKAAVKSGEGAKEAATALQTALTDNVAAINKFAGL